MEYPEPPFNPAHLRSEGDEVTIDFHHNQTTNLPTESTESTSRAKADLRTHLNEKKQLLNGNYFGLYSLEKSEQLKMQRNQSIKRAEELLCQFLKEKEDTKRTQISERTERQQNEEEHSHKISNKKENSQKGDRMRATEISSKVRESTRTSM